ncbi:hypothetical protein GW17_00002629 [Ensete ventricosum]|uniref:Uncharacterized protein n=2 Tax=Ensete ventricosum TaxID=4639 RepID=A0A426Z4D5_ENSVE|nr:hypothetical protein B296_00028236 [Ensete ventricosum]RWW32698.1 hypothetical protein GW17_00002629 [Ensete ventricosum]
MRIRCSNRDRHSQITTSAYGKYANSAVPTRPVQWENAVALPIPSQPIHTHPPPSCTRRYHLENSKRMGIVLRKMEQINQLPASLSMEDGLCELEMVVEKRKERWALQLGAVKDNATPSQYPWEPCFPLPPPCPPRPPLAAAVIVDRPVLDALHENPLEEEESRRLE